MTGVAWKDDVAHEEILRLEEQIEELAAKLRAVVNSSWPLKLPWLVGQLS